VAKAPQLTEGKNCSCNNIWFPSRKNRGIKAYAYEEAVGFLVEKKLRG